MSPSVAVKADGTPTASTFREVWGILHALQSFATTLNGRALIVYCDNLSARSILERGSSLRYINELVIATHELLASHGITADFRWQPRTEMQAADAISKWEGEWRLTEDAFESLGGLRRFDIDIFASETANHGLEFYGPAFSPSCDADHVDAFTRPWPADRMCLIFPPPRLINRAITHLRASKGRGVLITPAPRNEDWSRRTHRGAPGVLKTGPLPPKAASWHGPHDATRRITQWQWIYYDFPKSEQRAARS
jgi:hypothetical protein